jgi:hypothetical protein
VSIICINGTERGGEGNDSRTGKPWARGCETEDTLTHLTLSSLRSDRSEGEVRIMACERARSI